MKMRKIGRILTVMFLTGGLMTRCRKSKPWFYRKRAKRRGNRNQRAKTKKHRKFLFEEELPKDYEGHTDHGGGIPTTIRRLPLYLQIIQMSFEYISIEH